MSFSAEINDFVNGAKAGASIGGDIQDRKLRREKFEADQVFREGSASRADRALDIREKGIGARAADREARAAAKASGKAAKDAAKEEEKAHKAEIKDANDTVRSVPKSSSSDDSTSDDDMFSVDDQQSFDEQFPEGDPAEEELPTSSYEAIPVGSETVRFTDAGGLMEADEEVEAVAAKADSEAPQSAIPEEMPAKGAAVVPADPKPAEGKSDPIFKEAANITKEVFDTMESELSEKEEAVSTKPKKSQDRLSSVPAATPEEMKAIMKTIDPMGEMDQRLLGAKALVTAYNSFIKKGDAFKARSIATQIINNYRDTSKTRGMLALQALREGDLASASKLVSDAANDDVPDDVQVQAEPTPTGTVLYKIDKAGYAQQQGELGAKEMWALATGVADGSMFIKRMAALAGEADPTLGSNKPAIGEAVPSDGKKSSKTFSYKEVVRGAAVAKKQFDALQKKYDSEVGLNGEDSDSALSLKSELDESYTAYNKAMKLAQMGAKKLKKDKRFSTDFQSALRDTVLPPDGYVDPDAPAKTDAAAIPEMPTAPTPTAPAVGKPIDPATMAAAKAAIGQGRSRAGVLKKLQDAGYDTRGL
jgi:hypothetical protein